MTSVCMRKMKSQAANMLEVKEEKNKEETTGKETSDTACREKGFL